MYNISDKLKKKHFENVALQNSHPAYVALYLAINNLAYD